MKTKPEFTLEQQKEIARLARTATGPSVGNSSFWKAFLTHLDKIGNEHPAVVPKPKKD